MNLFEELNDYDLNRIVRKYDEFFVSAFDRKMHFDTTLYLSKSIIASVTLGPSSTSVHYMTEFIHDEGPVRSYHVSFVNSPNLKEINLFRNSFDGTELLSVFENPEQITEEILLEFSLTLDTFNNILVLSEQIIEMLKKDETVQKIMI